MKSYVFSQEISLFLRYFFSLSVHQLGYFRHFLSFHFLSKEQAHQMNRIVESRRLIVSIIICRRIKAPYLRKENRYNRGLYLRLFRRVSLVDKRKRYLDFEISRTYCEIVSRTDFYACVRQSSVHACPCT